MDSISNHSLFIMEQWEQGLRRTPQLVLCLQLLSWNVII